MMRVVGRWACVLSALSSGIAWFTLWPIDSIQRAFSGFSSFEKRSSRKMMVIYSEGGAAPGRTRYPAIRPPWLGAFGDSASPAVQSVPAAALLPVSHAPNPDLQNQSSLTYQPTIVLTQMAAAAASAASAPFPPPNVACVLHGQMQGCAVGRSVLTLY
jgi:hypothetical protein